MAATRPRIILLGDSIFDNRAYIGPGEDDVAAHLRARTAGRGWRVELRAVDGAVAADLPDQVESARLSPGAVCLLSVGGNDALAHIGVLEDARRNKSAADVLFELGHLRERFRAEYAHGLDAILATGAMLVVCTIYNGAFPDADFAGVAATGVALFNDVICHEALRRHVPVIELRDVCDSPACYANEIEPSHEGGARIAEAIEVALSRLPETRAG